MQNLSPRALVNRAREPGERKDEDDEGHHRRLMAGSLLAADRSVEADGAENPQHRAADLRLPIADDDAVGAGDHRCAGVRDDIGPLMRTVGARSADELESAFATMSCSR